MVELALTFAGCSSCRTAIRHLFNEIAGHARNDGEGQARNDVEGQARNDGCLIRPCGLFRCRAVMGQVPSGGGVSGPLLFCNALDTNALGFYDGPGAPEAG